MSGISTKSPEPNPRVPGSLPCSDRRRRAKSDMDSVAIEASARPRPRIRGLDACGRLYPYMLLRMQMGASRPVGVPFQGPAPLIHLLKP